MSSKQSIDLEQAMRKLAELHRDIHQDDEAPKNIVDEQSAVVKDGFQRLIMNLLLYIDECSIRAIELSLYYFWHHIFVRNVDLEAEADD